MEESGWIKFHTNGVIKEFVKSDFEIPSDLFKEYQYGKIPFSGKMIQKKYGYLLIPGIMMTMYCTKS